VKDFPVSASYASRFAVIHRQELQTFPGKPIQNRIRGRAFEQSGIPGDSRKRQSIQPRRPARVPVLLKARVASVRSGTAAIDDPCGEGNTVLGPKLPLASCVLANDDENWDHTGRHGRVEDVHSAERFSRLPRRARVPFLYRCTSQVPPFFGQKCNE